MLRFNQRLNNGYFHKLKNGKSCPERGVDHRLRAVLLYDKKVLLFRSNEEYLNEWRFPAMARVKKRADVEIISEWMENNFGFKSSQISYIITRDRPIHKGGIQIQKIHFYESILPDELSLNPKREIIEVCAFPPRDSLHFLLSLGTRSAMDYLINNQYFEERGVPLVGEVVQLHNSELELLSQNNNLHT